MMIDEPLANGGNGGRDGSGRFAAGNPGGPGNPYVRPVARLREMILSAVSDEDLRAVVGALVQKAKGGDVAAAHGLFNRLVGQPNDLMDPLRYELERKRLALEKRRVEAAEDRSWR